METNIASYNKSGNINNRLNHSWATNNPTTRTIIYFSVVILIAFLFSYCFSFLQVSFYTKKTSYLSLFLLLGIIHVFTFQKYLPHYYNEVDKILLRTLLLVALISSINFLLFHFISFINPYLAMVAGCSFLLPTTLVTLWNYFNAITAPTYQPWILVKTAIPQKKVALFLNGLQINIKVKINYFDMEEIPFTVTVSGHLQVAKAFQQIVIEEQPVKFQLLDNNQKPFGWIFILQRPYNTRVLNPTATIIENKIKQYDTIIAERIKMS